RILFEHGQDALAQVDERLLDPRLLLLILDGLVVDVGKAPEKPVDRLVRGVFAQRLERTHAVHALGVLVHRPREVLLEGACFAPLLREQIEQTHDWAGIYLRWRRASM